MFLGFDCAINISSRKRIADKLEQFLERIRLFLPVSTLSYFDNE